MTDQPLGCHAVDIFARYRDPNPQPDVSSRWDTEASPTSPPTVETASGFLAVTGYGATHEEARRIAVALYREVFAEMTKGPPPPPPEGAEGAGDNGLDEDGLDNDTRYDGGSA